jgi:transposase-like protein
MSIKYVSKVRKDVIKYNVKGVNMSKGEAKYKCKSCGATQTFIMYTGDPLPCLPCKCGSKMELKR